MNKPPTTSIRGLVGIKVPLLDTVESLKKELAQLARDEQFKLRLVAEENLHITVKFLGRIDRDQLVELNSLLTEVAEKTDSMELCIRRIGFFKNSLCLGIDENKELSSLASSLDKATSQLGFVRETKQFVPHITIARFDAKVKKRLAEFSARFANYYAGEIRVTSLNLYQSELHRDAAHYSTLTRVDLLHEH